MAEAPKLHRSALHKATEVGRAKRIPGFDVERIVAAYVAAAPVQEDEDPEEGRLSADAIERLEKGLKECTPTSRPPAGFAGDQAAWTNYSGAFCWAAAVLLLGHIEALDAKTHGGEG